MATTSPTTYPATRDLMTTAEVADMTRKSPGTMRYLRHVGGGPPSFRLGRNVVYDRAEVQAWIESEHAATVRGAGVSPPQRAA